MQSKFHPRGVGVLEAPSPWLCCPPLPGPELGPCILGLFCHKGLAGCYGEDQASWSTMGHGTLSSLLLQQTQGAWLTKGQESYLSPGPSSNQSWERSCRTEAGTGRKPQMGPNTQPQGLLDTQSAPSEDSLMDE